MEKIKNENTQFLSFFDVEELEERLENRWCTTTITDTCKETSETLTERC